MHENVFRLTIITHVARGRLECRSALKSINNDKKRSVTIKHVLGKGLMLEPEQHYYKVIIYLMTKLIGNLILSSTDDNLVLVYKTHTFQANLKYTGFFKGLIDTRKVNEKK